MSGTNNSGIWNQYGQGPAPMTGNEVFLASQSSATGATMYNYTSADLAAYYGTSVFPSPPPIGNTTPNTGKFTTLTTTGDLSIGTHFTVAASSGNLTTSGNIIAFAVATTGGLVSGGTVQGSYFIVGPSGPTISAGTGAPSGGTQPAGSLYLRTDGGTGSRLYVCAGGGVYNAVAGV